MNLLKIWNKRIKITSDNLKYNTNKEMIKVEVIYNKDLGESYKGKFVFSSELFSDRNIKIIKLSL